MKTGMIATFVLGTLLALGYMFPTATARADPVLAPVVDPNVDPIYVSFDCIATVGSCNGGGCIATVGSCDGGACVGTVGSCWYGECIATVGDCTGGSCKVTIGHCDGGSCIATVGYCGPGANCIGTVGSCTSSRCAVGPETNLVGASPAEVAYDTAFVCRAASGHDALPGITVGDGWGNVVLP